MRTLLKVSVLLNLGLISLVTWMLARERKPPSDSATPVAFQAGIDPSATVAPVAEAPLVQRAERAM